MWNLMAHAQKPDFVFPRNGRVHLNGWGHQFSQLLAAEVCASAWVMVDTPRSEVAWEYWLPTSFASFPFTSPPVRHRAPPGSERALTSSEEEVLIVFFKLHYYSYKTGSCTRSQAVKWRVSPPCASLYHVTSQWPLNPPPPPRVG